ncbi:Uncharacterised protein [Mycobacteroides abscessus subsp. abscessus]|nr:Uncharacterised protein [Mycobacteroides abscessus subsp. abscessus]SKU22403.1 Uncharacterised protein [Mycobacteroides abscessus subsp. abscessus]
MSASAADTAKVTCCVSAPCSPSDSGSKYRRNRSSRSTTRIQLSGSYPASTLLVWRTRRMAPDSASSNELA